MTELRSFSELHPSYFFNTPILRACIPRSVRPLTEWRDDLRYLAPEKDTPRCWLCCRSRLRSAIASLTRLASTKSSVPHTRRNDGKNVHIRVRRITNADLPTVRTWGAHERV